MLLLAALLACGGTKDSGIYGPSVAEAQVPAALAACPDSPNCVSSQEEPSDSEHHIAALPLGTRDADQALAELQDVVLAQPRAVVQVIKGPYVAATFTSKIFRWVDDVEFLIDEEAGVVHVRSASRVGKSDLGVNRKRVETLRAAWDSGGAQP